MMEVAIVVLIVIAVYAIQRVVNYLQRRELKNWRPGEVAKRCPLCNSELRNPQYKDGA